MAFHSPKFVQIHLLTHCGICDYNRFFLSRNDLLIYSKHMSIYFGRVVSHKRMEYSFQGAKGTAINCFCHWLLESMVHTLLWLRPTYV